MIVFDGGVTLEAGWRPIGIMADVRFEEGP